MAIETISIEPGSSNSAAVNRAAAALAAGALVAFPTETVYGLGVNAAVEDSVQRLRKLKGRAAERPFTVHIGRRSDCEKFVPRMSPVARRLSRKGWPGPLTLVFPVEDASTTAIYPTLSAGGIKSIYSENSVGIRYPDHPLGAALLAKVEAPVIATSANLAGEPPPTDANAVRERLGDSIDVLLDAGPCRFKHASTIVSVVGDDYQIVRDGAIDSDAVRRLATLEVLLVCSGNTCRSPMAEGILRQFIAEKLGCPPAEIESRGVHVSSAGTLAMDGGRATPEAVEVCRRRGIDISNHRSRSLAGELIQTADLIYTMGGHHLEMVRSLNRGDPAKAAQLDSRGDISDPVGGTIEDYENAAERITTALRERLPEVLP